MSIFFLQFHSTITDHNGVMSVETIDPIESVSIFIFGCTRAAIPMNNRTAVL